MLTLRLAVFFAWGVSAALVQAAPQPNIVVIYADDLGYGDVSCYNPERGKLETPNIDRLAAEGIRFTDAHSSSGVCSPSRYTLLTGRYHWRTRLQRGIVGLWEPPLISPNRMTVASLLRQHGYQTAAFGKWHLGWDWPADATEREFLKGAKNARASDRHREIWHDVFSQSIGGGPTTRGFERYFGTDVPNWPPFCFIEDDRTLGIPTEFLPEQLFQNNLASQQGPAMANWKLESILPTLGNRAAEYIREAAAKTEPYFLYLPLTSPHTPLAVNDSWKGKSGLGAYGDLVMETDAVIGRVLAAIQHSGEADQTLVILTSDNGCAPYIGVAEMEQKGHFPSGPLRGYKSDVWEGGHRVPFVVRWPGVVAPGGVNRQLVHQADLMATCAELVGYPLTDQQGEDSYSIMALLRGSDEPIRPHGVNQSSNGIFAVRRGPWKLILGKGSGGWTKGSDDLPGQLYNLDDDLAESHNLYAERPDLVGELKQLLEKIVTDGRSTPGTRQPNDVLVNWNRIAD